MAQARKNTDKTDNEARRIENLSEDYILGSESVPSDWYVDPATPTAHKESVLEQQATAFLERHETSHGGTVLAEPQDLFGPKPTITEESAQEEAWLELLSAGAGAGNEEGELAWQAEALCAQTDPEVFFPEKGGSTRDAKKVCSGCSVRQQCLDYALSNDERFGIWGGMSERERRRLRKNVI